MQEGALHDARRAGLPGPGREAATGAPRGDARDQGEPQARQGGHGALPLRGSREALARRVPARGRARPLRERGEGSRGRRLPPGPPPAGGEGQDPRGEGGRGPGQARGVPPAAQRRRRPADAPPGDAAVRVGLPRRPSDLRPGLRRGARRLPLGCLLGHQRDGARRHARQAHVFRAAADHPLHAGPRGAAEAASHGALQPEPGLRA
mmetsp:Transcript_44072/g.130505  ORF Transcript_44072/g.130505 Transcript_44072/m.130505 type:complete len:206 (+) Transcript_44072:145-762(+)